MRVQAPTKPLAYHFVRPARAQYKDELQVYQLHFGIKPCKYPTEEAWGLVWEGGRGRTGMHLVPVVDVGALGEQRLPNFDVAVASC